MRYAKILERNKRIKGMARKAAQRVERAVIHSIDGDRVNIRLNNSPTLVRHVEVAGDVGALKPNLEVAILWKENRPVVLAGQPSVLSLLDENLSQPASILSARVIRTSNQAATGSATTTAAITFDSVIYDTSRMFNINAPTQLAIPANGIYLIVGAYQTASNGAAGHAAAALMLNGDTTIAHINTYTSSTTYEMRLSVTGLAKLKAGDFIELFAGSTQATKYVEDFSPTLTIARLYE